MSESEVKATPNLQVLEKAEEIKVPPGELGATLELIVRNKKGEVTERQMVLSESFVKAFLTGICIAMSRTASYKTLDPLELTDYLDTECQIGISSSQFLCSATAGQDYWGIEVGTGITAPTITDTKMETQIAHGVGVGEMQYSAVTFGAPASDGVTAHFTVTRDFSNNSGGSITVREIGLVCRLGTLSGTTYFLTIRDAVNIAVPDGETLTVNYRIQATA